MKEKEVIGSLNDDVSSLDKNQKQQFVDMSYLATDDVEKKKGRARKIKIKTPSKNGFDFELVATNKNIKRNPYPKAEDKLKVIGLSKKVSSNLKKMIINGNINSNHITDLQKLNMIDKLIKLNSEDQNTAVKSVIENRNKRNIINAEEISSFIIRNGYEDEFTLETWYSGIIRLIDKLSSHANVDVDICTRLSNEQQLNLRKKIDNLNAILSRFR